MADQQVTERQAQADARVVFGVPPGVIVLGIARMADGFGNSFLIIVLPLFIDGGRVSGGLLGLSRSTIAGLVLGLFGVVLSFAQPFTGRLSDRLGRRQALIVVGLLVMSAVNFAFTVAGTYLRVRAGAGAESGSKLSVLTMAFALGRAVGQFSSGALLRYGFVAPFAFGAVLAGIGAGLVRVYVRDPAHARAVRSSGFRGRTRARQRPTGQAGCMRDPVRPTARGRRPGSTARTAA